MGAGSHFGFPSHTLVVLVAFCPFIPAANPFVIHFLCSLWLYTGQFFLSASFCFNSKVVVVVVVVVPAEMGEWIEAQSIFLSRVKSAKDLSNQIKLPCKNSLILELVPVL